MPTYATPDDFKNYLFGESSSENPPANSVSLLRQASDIMRDFTKQAVYDVDANELPTDTAKREAFRDATCAQASYWHHRGIDPEQGTQATRLAQSKSLGSASITYVIASGQVDAEADLASGVALYVGAYRILRRAGLITTGVDTTI